MNIFHISSEFAPFSKVGGLADVVSSLCFELKKKSYKISVILPRYPWIKKELFSSWKKVNTPLFFFENNYLCNNEIFKAYYQGIPLYFIDPHHPKGFFSRKNIYGYEDDIPRFLYFSKAALVLIQFLKKK